MKNILSFLVLSLCASSAIAQPTLTGATINPVAGEKFYEHDFDTTGISKGASGAGVTWNFSGTGTPVSDSALYIACSATPFCDSFPGSTLATYDGTEYTYFTTDASRFAFSGVGEFIDSGGGCVYYPELQDIIGYPTTYNSIKVDTYYSSQPTFQYSSHGIDSFIADAYGTLILPSGTYSNVMRVHMIDYETDSFFLSSSSWDVEPSRSEIYFWYQPGFHNPLLLLEYDTSGGVPYLSDAAYYTQDTVSTHTAGIISLLNDGQCQVYPNPASDEVHIRYASPVDQIISVSATDVVGRVAMQSLSENITAGANDIACSVASLPIGMYYLRIQAAEKTTVVKIFISR